MFSHEYCSSQYLELHDFRGLNSPRGKRPIIQMCSRFHFPTCAGSKVSSPISNTQSVQKVSESRSKFVGFLKKLFCVFFVDFVSCRRAVVRPLQAAGARLRRSGRQAEEGRAGCGLGQSGRHRRERAGRGVCRVQLPRSQTLCPRRPKEPH